MNEIEMKMEEVREKMKIADKYFKELMEFKGMLKAIKERDKLKEESKNGR